MQVVCVLLVHIWDFLLTDFQLILLLAVLLLIVAGIAIVWLQSHDTRWRAGYAQYLESRERQLVGMIADSVGLFRDGIDPRHAPGIVVGQSALSTRYFGNVIPDTVSRYRLQNGDRYTLICQLARREAVIEMLEAAKLNGYNAVCDIQIDATDMGHTLNRAQRAMVIVTATGTAYRVV